jgi:hypothetical protein
MHLGSVTPMCGRVTWNSLWNRALFDWFGQAVIAGTLGTEGGYTNLFPENIANLGLSCIPFIHPGPPMWIVFRVATLFELAPHGRHVSYSCCSGLG